MADREKLLDGLNKIREFFEARADMAVGDGKLLLLNWANTARDALELLKEQEPVSPIPYQQDTSIGFFAGFKCGNCNAVVFPDYRFCPICGKAVKWGA